ncbi:MAG: hypothetical protein GC164_01500 [Phycisphaera sp.]|nr:hypothetical protein [Phycisphaera sp.]
MQAQNAPNIEPRRLADLYFMEHRAKLLDIAAFLDRIDRAKGATNPGDHRVTVLQRVIPILTDGQPERVRRILDALSDPSTEPIAQASVKGATGVPPADKTS